MWPVARRTVRALVLSSTPRLNPRHTATRPRRRHVFTPSHWSRPLAAGITGPARRVAVLSSAIRAGWTRRQVLPSKGGVAWHTGMVSW